jgi:ankyrin repeat protein
MLKGEAEHHRGYCLKVFLLFSASCIVGCGPSIHDYIAHGELEEAQAFIQSDVSQLSRRDSMEKTPLHSAVIYNRLEMIPFLMEQGADIDPIDVTGMTPLHYSAFLGRRKAAQILIQHEASVDARDQFGDTPLHSAAMKNQVGMVNTLLKYKANVRSKNNAGLTPYELAIKHDAGKTISRLKLLESDE